MQIEDMYLRHLVQGACDSVLISASPLLQAVLESIRDSLNEQLVIPEWLVDIFLGYGDAGAAHYTQMPNDTRIKTVDFKVSGLTSTCLLYTAEAALCSMHLVEVSMIQLTVVALLTPYFCSWRLVVGGCEGCRVLSHSVL